MLKGSTFRMYHDCETLHIERLTTTVVVDLFRQGKQDLFLGINELTAKSFLENGVAFGCFGSDGVTPLGYLIATYPSAKIHDNYCQMFKLSSEGSHSILALKGLAVHPHYQKCGIGTHLLNLAYLWSKRKYVDYLVGAISPDHYCLKMLESYSPLFTIPFQRPAANIPGGSVNRTRFCIKVS